ncbi:protein red1 [Trichoderma asperellum]|uniref:Protein red1 n=1 Tax=Trichoderma asperellum TaxID=101201 RepID=A0A6V8R5L6_TRIAP|nr:protein red1 [Trichoderma asperellum]
MDHPAMTTSVHEGQFNQITPLASSQTSPKANGASHTISNSPQVKSVGATRKQAQDAIRRLWTLNVRYQNYVDEGIDETLLGGLFEELGFEIGASSTPKSTQSSRERATAPEMKAKDGLGRTDGIPQQAEAEKSAESAPPKDVSESRKDRIARLLAAKNSKSNITAATASSSSTPAPVLAPASKKQSDKSKLLHQKMEALRKARELEARGRKRSHPDELPLQSHQANNNVDDSTTTSSHDMAANSLHRTSPEHTSGETPSPNGQLPPPIPGLFLSSTPQPPHAIQVLNLERPASTSLVDSNPRPFKRPFGHVRRPRPFLIDVSDDEDDAEMDLDSPEQRTVPLATKEAAPPLLETTLSFRSAPSFGDSVAAAQQYSSPLATPPGASSDNSATRDNLDNMTKKIEAMKKRIAEAEARKKAKQSRLDSPAFPALNNESPSSSFEAVIPSQEIVVPIPSTSIEPQELPRSTPPLSNSSPMAPSRSSEASPQSGNERRSRSVAASERLPLIEARRREQQLKLKLLRAQVENMQREIQKTMEEEEKLRIDVNADSESEETHEEQHAMDIASMSSQSNNAARQSREATPLEREESQREQQPDLPTAHQAEHNPLDVQPNTAIEAVDAVFHPLGVGANTTIEAVDDAKQEAMQNAMSTQDDADATATAVVEEAQDMVMSEAADSSNHSSEEESDSYEPPDVELSSHSKKSSRASTPFSPAPAGLDSMPDTSTNSLQDSTTDFIAAQPISTVQPDIASESNQVDPVSEARATLVSDAPKTAFVPYESPLRYFHAYRFHPEYSQSISGGLRSLTYSNKIDVKQELCPDDLANQSCPRGSKCAYQHFENMQAPDDQILLQLGAHEEFGEQEKQQYINGLRNLLTDFRNRKVKDFQTISQGIIDYRAQFLGDRSKILPLGGVKI